MLPRSCPADFKKPIRLKNVVSYHVTCAISSERNMLYQFKSVNPIVLAGMHTNHLHNRLGVRALSQRSGSGTPQKSKAGILASLGLGASFLFGKTKFLFAALKITKAAPLISMLVTSATYSLFFGWPYACGMVGLIFIHECGHAIVMHRYGVPFSPMVFVPFMGAVIAMKEHPTNAYQEAIIAFGGPLLGTAGALGVSLLGQYNDSQLLLALADFGFIINLFNLLPIGSLDGGRIGGAISPAFGIAGLVGGGYLIYADLIHNPLFYLILAGGAYSTTSRLLGWDADSRPRGYYDISYEEQSSLFVLYAGLVAGALYALRENNKYRKTPKQLEKERQNPWATTEKPWTQDDGNVYDDFFESKNEFPPRGGSR